jgi:hypothetical protein
MYLTQRGGGSAGFFPTNTKWGSTSTLTGLLPGGDLRGQSLGYWRPNFAMARGNYPGMGQITKDVFSETEKWYLGRMGQVAVDPNLLGVGIGALALGMFLLGGKHGPKLRKRKAARLRRRLAALEA